MFHQATIYGIDPNWGRIAAAACYSGVSFHQDLLRVELGDILLMYGGEPQLFDRAGLHHTTCRNRSRARCSPGIDHFLFAVCPSQSRLLEIQDEAY
ncbi:hypothetical protein AAZV13_18G107000 [Glycine max]|uniref:Arginine biosynthesis bifunctional protein ArgJ, chloroplastic n=1 Tax=Glycine soja TaxID=3848 RepID=A0A0B2R8P6_GLYSO|nr:Arginine biosynthesis bifunctional protein ArgJ, chloroplastic [Glycine soja]